MSSKVKLILLWVFCCLAIVSTISDEEQQQWLNNLMNSYEFYCRDKISDEFFQQLKDDFEADNEQIREYRLCLAEKAGYIEDREIKPSKIMEDYKIWAKNGDDSEFKTAGQVIKLCIDEAKDGPTAVDVAGLFSKCLADRCKSAI